MRQRESSPLRESVPAIDGGEVQAARRAVTYCIVPRELAAKLHEPLKRHFRDDPSIEVIVEHRNGERRRSRDRRRAKAKAPRADRRLIRNRAGRRAGDRRTPVAAAEPPPLPRRAQRHADRLVFVERVEPSAQSVEDLDSARLVNRFQAGDREAAFSALYLRYFDRLFSYLKVAFKDYHEAEDAAQQTFTNALEALPAYKPSPKTPFRGWLFVIARNHAVSELRKLNRIQVEEPSEIDRRRDRAQPAEEMAPVFDWISDCELLMFVEHLPPSQREVLVLRYLLDLPHKQIAAILGKNANEVRMLQHRAVEQLKDRLTAIGRAPERVDRSLGWERREQQDRVLRNRRFALS